MINFDIKRAIDDASDTIQKPIIALPYDNVSGSLWPQLRQYSTLQDLLNDFPSEPPSMTLLEEYSICPVPLKSWTSTAVAHLTSKGIATYTKPSQRRSEEWDPTKMHALSFEWDENFLSLKRSKADSPYGTLLSSLATVKRCSS